MHPRLRLALAPVLLLACAPSEDRGCQSDPTVPACFAAESTSTSAVALDSVAHVTGPVNVGRGAIEVVVSTDQPDTLRLLEDRVTVDSCANARVRVKALRAGTVALRFALPDGTATTVTVEVAPAKKVRLVPFLDEVVQGARVRGEAIPVEKDVKELVQFAGGKAVWRLDYATADDRPLRGTGATTYTLPAGATSRLVPNEKDRELFELTAPTSAGADPKLEARAGSALLMVPLRVVPADAITSIRVYAEDEGPAPRDGGTDPKRLSVVARASDARGVNVHGVPFTYTLGASAGAAAETASPGGPLLGYGFARAAPQRQVVATVAGSPAKGEIGISAATPADLQRSDADAYANCSASPGSTARGAGAGASASLAAIALVLGWRRRRAGEARARPLVGVGRGV